METEQDSNRSRIKLTETLDNLNSKNESHSFSIIKSEKDHSSQQNLPQPKKNYNYANSNFLSKIFFTWSKIAIQISNKRPLLIEDIGNVSEKQSLNYSMPKLKETLLKNKNRKYPLMMTIFLSNIKLLFLLLCLDMCNVGIDYAKMFFYRRIIQIFSKNDFFPKNDKINFLSLSSLLNYKFNIIQCSIFYVTIKFIRSFIFQHLQFNNECLSIKITNEITALITEKVLKTKSITNFNLSKNEGEKINLAEMDAERVGSFFFSGPKILTAPVKVIISMTLLFKLFGKDFFFTFGVLVIIMIIIAILQVIYIKNLNKLMIFKDKRMKIVTFVFQMLKNLKLNGWDDEFMKRIKIKRDDELKHLNKNYNLELINFLLNSNINLILMICCFTFFLNSNKELEISTLFTAFQLINSMTFPLMAIPFFLNRFFSNMLSINRIQKFLDSEENEIYNRDNNKENNNEIAIKFDNATFGIKDKDKILNNNKKINKIKNISKNAKPTELSEIKTKIRKLSISENSILLENINISIKKGEFVSIIGTTGSGKSCLINAILNNYHIFSQNSKNIINGDISYYSQIPWTMTDTIKNNILFYDEYDEKKYNNIISLCQLETDFERLALGDKTLINSTNSNVSGGQKARITLARCLYKNVDIYIFDDPFSSIDNRVSQKIFEDAFCKYLNNKTRIFVTNEPMNLSKFDKIILMDKGKITFFGNYEEYKKKFSIKDNSENEISKNDNSKNEEKDEKNTEIMWEEGNKSKERNKNLNEFLNLSSNKSVSKKLYHQYIKLQGGYFVFFTLIILIIICRIIGSYRRTFVPSLTKSNKRSKFLNNTNATNIISNITLNNITNNNITNEESSIKFKNNFIYYVKLSLLGIFLNLLVEYIIKQVTLNSIKNIHEKMVYKFVKAPINLFHDLVPLGQILNYLTKDIEFLQHLIGSMNHFIKIVFTLISTIGLCYIYNKASLFLTPLILISTFLLNKYFLKAGRNLVRLQRITYPPILTILSETIRGVDIIKTSHCEKETINKMYEKLDIRNGIAIYNEGGRRWFNLCRTLCSHLFFNASLFYMIYYSKYFSAEAIAIVLQSTEDFIQLLINASVYYTQLETSLIGLERCETVLKFETEKISPKKNLLLNNDNNWPKNGEIKFINYYTGYRPNTPMVLKNINFEINSGKKIGIVGRTGSGKSSIVLALSRVIEPIKGKILIDDIDLQNVNLDFLRKKITIIPQDPFLIESNLRDNLDPLKNYSDEYLLKVLNDFDLFSDVENKLDINIKEGGKNLSTGQKQLICFARAIIKNNKIFIMDEAVSSLDIETKKIIQNNMKKYLQNITVINITHKIEMLEDCDVIFVIDNGEIVETGKYEELVNDKDSTFYSLYLKGKNM